MTDVDALQRIKDIIREDDGFRGYELTQVKYKYVEENHSDLILIYKDTEDKPDPDKYVYVKYDKDKGITDIKYYDDYYKMLEDNSKDGEI